MNQQCKVCGEPAAGFHFGAFTCEGCKSFFGRSYNNLNSITECKNNGECIINKKNRTACKSCRLRKCLLVGMSKSGSRYGRRSNWFKIHCLLQEQQQAAVSQLRNKNPSTSPTTEGNQLPLLSPLGFPHPNLTNFLRPENPSSPSVSSPDSDSSENGVYSPRINGTNHPFPNKDFYFPLPFHSVFLQPPSLTSPFLLPPSLFPFAVRPPKPSASPDQVQNKFNSSSASDLEEENRNSPLNNNDYSSKNKNYHSITSNNNNNEDNEETKVKMRSKRFYLDAILGLQNSRSPKNELEESNRSPKYIKEDINNIQDDPIDLSVKRVDKTKIEDEEEKDEESDEQMNKPNENKIGNEIKIDVKQDEVKQKPLDLTV